QLAPVHSCGRPIDSRRGAPRTLHSFPTRRSSDLAPVEALEHYARIVGEPAGDVAIGPAAEIVERRGQVPVIERAERLDAGFEQADRKSTRLNSSHVKISYAVFSVKKKRKAEHGRR